MPHAAAAAALVDTNIAAVVKDGAVLAESARLPHPDAENGRQIPLTPHTARARAAAPHHPPIAVVGFGSKRVNGDVVVVV